MESEFGKKQRKKKGIDAENMIVTRVWLKEIEEEMKEVKMDTESLKYCFYFLLFFPPSLPSPFLCIQKGFPGCSSPRK